MFPRAASKLYASSCTACDVRTPSRLRCTVLRHFRFMSIVAISRLRHRNNGLMEGFEKSHNCIRGKDLSEVLLNVHIAAAAGFHQSPRTLLSYVTLPSSCPASCNNKIHSRSLVALFVSGERHHKTFCSRKAMSHLSEILRHSAPASAIATTEVSPRSFHAPLKFAVADDEDVLLLTADKLDALVNTRIELVETCKHVA